MSVANTFKLIFTNHDGTGHKIAHNITTILNIPLTLWFMYSVFTLRSASYEEVSNYMQSPFNMVVAILFVACALKHFALEIEVVFEDYISNISARNATIITMKIFFLVLGLTATISILKLGL